MLFRERKYEIGNTSTRIPTAAFDGSEQVKEIGSIVKTVKHHV